MKSGHLVQLLLPLFDNDGARFNQAEFKAVSEELTAQFGGVTSFSRTPAEGLWAEADQVNYDQIVVIETMVEDLDIGWWGEYREQLTSRFRQRDVVVRSNTIVIL